MVSTNAITLPKARLIGLLYLVNIVGCATSELVGRAPIVWSDPVATTVNIMANEAQFRAGIFAETVAVIAFLTAAGLFYQLLKPVSRTFAGVSALFAATQAAVHLTTIFFQFAPLALLQSRLEGAFSPAQIQVLVLILLKLRAADFNFCLVMFGMYFLTIGVLAIRSTYLPWFVGLLLLAAAAGCTTQALLQITGVPASPTTFIATMVPFGLGRLLVGLWFLLRGVNQEKWQTAAE